MFRSTFFTDNSVSVFFFLLCPDRSIKAALDKLDLSQNDGADVYELVSHCIKTFKHGSEYRNDIRFLKIWLIYVISFPSFSLSIWMHYISSKWSDIVYCLRSRHHFDIQNLSSVYEQINPGFFIYLSALPFIKLSVVSNSESFVGKTFIYHHRKSSL